MISRLLALFRNRASSPEEARLEDALRSESTRLRAKPEADEVAVANIVEHAKRRSRLRQNESVSRSRWLPSRTLFGGATILALILLALKLGNEPQTKDIFPQQAQQKNPDAEMLFANPMETLANPFASFAFNPLEPATEEWYRFTGDTREKAGALFATAKAWTTLPAPDLSLDPETFLPELPELRQFSPYGNELRRLRNDALNAVEALPFFLKING